MKSLAIKIIQTLEDNGHEAYFIGGSVRNILHYMKHGQKLEIKDYDIVTSASCEQVMELFKDTEARGVQFNVAVVRLEGHEFEVAQFRGETYPEGGSLRPDKVFAVDTLEEDLKRRDFTINAIAMDKDDNIIDPLGGVSDIQEKVIRTVGDPNLRFSEDPLRMIRAFRFVSQLDYYLEGKTRSGIKKNLNLLNKVPHERMKEEIHKLLKGQAVEEALREMKYMRLWRYTFRNSITDKQVNLLKGVLNLPDRRFYNMLYKLSQLDRTEMDMSEIFYLLYYYTPYEVAEREIKSMMFLSEKELDKALIMLKNQPLVLLQTSLEMYNLVKDIGEQRGLAYLNEILDSYKKIHNVNFDKLNTILKRPLFKYQLGFNGNDVIELAKEKNLSPGKWVGEVLDRAQMYSIFGANYDLETIFNEIVS